MKKNTIGLFSFLIVLIVGLLLISGHFYLLYNLFGLIRDKIIATGLNRNLSNAITSFIFAFIVILPLGNIIKSLLPIPQKNKKVYHFLIAIIVGLISLLFYSLEKDSSFNTTTGNPEKKYTIYPNGEIVLFNTDIKFDPKYGNKLKLVTKEIIKKYEAQKNKFSEKPDTNLNSQHDIFFNPLDGRPTKKYTIYPNGTIVLFDTSYSFDPKYRHLLKPVTEEIVNKFEAQRITTSNQENIHLDSQRNIFFNPQNGKPIKKYAIYPNGKIIIFNIDIDFDPTYGDSLKKITPEIVKKYINQEQGIVNTGIISDSIKSFEPKIKKNVFKKVFDKQDVRKAVYDYITKSSHTSFSYVADLYDDEVEFRKFGTIKKSYISNIIKKLFSKWSKRKLNLISIDTIKPLPPESKWLAKFKFRFEYRKARKKQNGIRWCELIFREKNKTLVIVTEKGGKIK